MELFKLLGTIAINNSEANSEIDKTTSKASLISSSFTDAGKTMTKVGKNLLPVTAALGGVGVASGKMAIEFEDSIANINTLLDDDSHLSGYENSIKTISRETGLSAENMANGMYQAISSLGDGGKETEKMFSTMAIAAKSGGADVSDSVSLISAGMKGYNSVNDETAKKISDLAFQTAKLGVTTFPEMATSMQPLFPLASSLNLSYEDLFGSMATLTGVTGNTAEVSTQLKAVFSNLMKPTDDMQKVIEKYGFSSGQAMLESEGLSGMLKIVKEETGGQADKMAALFSSTEAVTAMTALTGSQFDTFNDKLKQMGSSTGATEAAYEKLNTKGDSLKKTWNNMKIAGLELGTALMSTLSPMIEGVSDKVAKFSEWFSSLTESQQKTIVKVAGVVAALGPLLIIFGKISTGIGSVIKIGGSLMGGAGKLMGAIKPLFALLSANPIAIVIAAISALVAGFIYLWNNCEAFRDFWIGLWEGIKEAFGAVADWFGEKIEAIKGFFTGLSDKAAALKDGISDKFGQIKDSVSEKVEGMKGAVSEKFNGIKDTMGNVMGAAKDTVQEKLNNIKTAYEENGGGIKGIASGAMEGVKGYYSAGYTFIDKLTGGKLSGITSKFSSGMKNIKGKVSSGIDSVKTFFSDGMQNTLSAVSKKLESIKNKFKSILDGAKKIVKSGIDKIKGFFNFDWSLPKIKLPHFNIDGKFSLDPPSIPHFGIKWYKKAMDNPMVMTSPTAFGMSADGKIMAGGEAGSEVVSGTNTLMNMIASSVSDQNAEMKNTLESILNILVSMLKIQQDHDGGDIVIPVTIGTEAIDEIIVSAKERVGKRSGGRSYA